MPNQRLNDVQTILLSAASRHAVGSLLPLPSAYASDLVRTNKAITALVSKGLAIEMAVSDRRLAWRDADENPTGVFITPVGQEAIGLSEAVGGSADGGCETERAGLSAAIAKRTTTSATSRQKPGAGNKSTLVLDLLCRPTGATLTELVAVTGWLPHTARAALTGLRKKGHEIVREKREDETCYTIEAAA